jgi:hypothetical protein
MDRQPLPAAQGKSLAVVAQGGHANDWRFSSIPKTATTKTAIMPGQTLDTLKNVKLTAL